MPLQREAVSAAVLMCQQNATTALSVLRLLVEHLHFLQVEASQGAC